MVQWTFHSLQLGKRHRYELTSTAGEPSEFVPPSLAGNTLWCPKWCSDWRFWAILLPGVFVVLFVMFIGIQYANWSSDDPSNSTLAVPLKLVFSKKRG